jgi:carbonic anhydrase
MKFNRGLILSIFTLITLAINVSQIISTQAKNKRSIVDFMQKFLSSDNDRKNIMGQLNNKNYESQNQRKISSSQTQRGNSARFKEGEGEGEAEASRLNLQYKKKARKTNNRIRAQAQYRLESEMKSKLQSELPGLNTNTTQREETPKPILEEWFMISSETFLSNEKFPPIHTGKGVETLGVKTDASNFRINGAYGHKSLADKLPNDKFFYFRLSGLNIFYSSTKTDINILGTIAVESINEVLSLATDASTEYITTCFTVIDKERQKWKICGMSEPTVKLWFCQIKTFLNIMDLNNCPAKTDSNTAPIIEKTTEITQPVIIIPTASKFCNENWNYQKLTEDWECDCKEGKEQSPIDLPEIKKAIDSSLKPLMEYAPVKETCNEETIDGAIPTDGVLRIQLKENLLRIFAKQFGRIVTIDGAIYIANEINIHSPSEHTINGKKYDLEITILHSGESKGDIAKSASLSFLFEKSPGKYNGFIEDLDIFDLPSPLDPNKNLKKPINIANILKSEENENIEVLNPFSFFTYQGSLTTPPCNEDTIVYVASEPLKIGSTALQLIQETTRIPDMMDAKGNIINSNFVNETSRPVQPLNGRPVFHYDHTNRCMRPDLKPAIPKGHYEKIRKAFTTYFYVNTNKPSGLPNSYVVSEGEAKGTAFGPVVKKP